MFKAFLNWFRRNKKRNPINDGVPQQIPKPYASAHGAQRAKAMAERQERNLQMPIPPRPVRDKFSDAPPRPTVRRVETRMQSSRANSHAVPPTQDNSMFYATHAMMHQSPTRAYDEEGSTRRSVCEAPSRDRDDYSSPSSDNSSPCGGDD